MSSRNHHTPCHKKIPTCKLKKACPPVDHCSKNSNPCGPSHEDPCSSSRGCGVPGQNNNNVGYGADAPPPISKQEVEAEVDRLVDCARAWSEKEKFKLKQYYEEEMVRKKKAVIQEFKCAMEREVIAPLKKKLCDYEREIHNLRKQLEAGGGGQVQAVECKEGQGNDAQGNMKVSVDLEVVDKMVEKARRSNQKLLKLIHGEKARKSTKGGILVPPSIELPPDEPGTETEGQRSRSPSAQSRRQSGDNEEAVDEEPQEGAGATTSRKSSRKSEGDKTKGDGQEDVAAMDFLEDEDGEAVEETDIFEKLLNTSDMTEETKALLGKLKEIHDGFVETAAFTIEEIQDLMREHELMESYKKRTEDLEIENEELKKRIKELMEMLENMKPGKGSVEEENMMLRQRIQELEGERTRGSLQSELRLLKEQLEDAWRKNEEAKDGEGEGQTPGESKLELIPEEEGELPDGGNGSTLGSTPGKSPENKTPGSKPQSRKSSKKEEEVVSPTISKGPSAKTLSGKSSGESQGEKPRSEKPASEKAKAASEKAYSEKAVSARRSSSGKKRVSQKSEGLSARSLGEVTGPFEDKIKLLAERIMELEDHLNAMAELEVRLKELEEQNKELEKLRAELKALQAECDELRSKECPVCPVPSETELKEARKRLEELEKILEEKTNELNSLMDKLKGMELANEELSRSVASFKQVEKKHEELETMHAQVLEEKRRRSMEARDLATKLAQVEQELSNAQKELDEMRDRLGRKEDDLRSLEELRDRLEAELAELKRKLADSSGDVEDLKRQLREKEALLEELRGRNAALEDEVQIARKKLDDAVRDKEALDRELDTVRRHCEQVQNDLMKQLREQQKKCSEACDVLSKRGQCILEHEKKCMNVTDRMEKDNEMLQEKLRQMQNQLDAMVNMERTTRALHGEMEEFHKRAQERSRELEELKKLPETCDIKGMESSASVLPSPLFSLPSLPTPSQMDNRPQSGTTVGGGAVSGVSGGSGSSGKAREQCKLLSAQLRDLEKEKDDLSSELQGKLRAVEDINRQMEELQRKDGRLRDEVDKACKD